MPSTPPVQAALGALVALLAIGAPGAMAQNVGTPVDLWATGPAGEDAHEPQIAVGPDGATTVAWERTTSSNQMIQTSTSAPTLALLSVSRSGSGSGTFALTCTMGRSVTNQLRSGAITCTLVTTFTDTAGAQVTTRSNGLLPRRPGRTGARVPVTG
jgi:hypothetical protein